MAKSTTETETKPRRVGGVEFPTFDPASFSAVTGHGAGAAHRAADAFAKGMTAYQKHVMDFTKRRMERDLETGRAFATCRTPADAAKVHSRFVENMINDYFEEWHALLSIGAGMAKGVVQPIEENAVETLEAAERRGASELN